METTVGLWRAQSARYQIKIQGRQAKGWSDWMEDLKIEIEQTPEGITITTLSGVVKDQSALHGILNRIRDLSILLISVQFVHQTDLEKERNNE